MGREREPAAMALAVCWKCQARLRHDQLICARCGATRPTARMRAVAAQNPQGDPFRGDMESWREDTRTRVPAYVPGAALSDQAHALPSYGTSYPPVQPSPGSPTVAFPPHPVSPTLVAVAEPDDASAPPVTTPASVVQQRLIALARAFFRETAEVWRATGFALLGALIGGGLWLGVAFSVHYESGFLAIPLGLLVGEGVAIGATVRRHRYTLYALGLLIFCWALCIRLLASHQLDWSPLDAAYLFFALMGCTAPVDRLPLRSFHRRVKARWPSM